MVLFLSYFLDFSDQYNDGNNSAGHSLGPCSWWQNITNNAFTVQILFVICFLIRYSCIKWQLHLTTAYQIKTTLGILHFKKEEMKNMVKEWRRKISGCLWENSKEPRVLWPQLFQKQGTLLWLCFHALPRHVTSNYSLQLAFVVYSPLSHKKNVFAICSLPSMCSLPMWLYTLLKWLLLTLRCSE